MHKTQAIFAAVLALSGAAAGCSSDEPETTTPQPAASQGAEATPPEPDLSRPATVAPATAVPAAEPVAPPPNAMSEPGDSPAPESLRDAQILKIVDLVNTAEVEQAQIAKTKATHKDVKQFAQMMITQHTQAKQKAAELGRKVNLMPEQSTQAGTLEGKAAQTLATLKMVDATAFDAEYMSAQVQEHQEVLDLLTTKLIPSATDPKLKAELENTRTVVQRHLGSAQQIQQSLK